MHDNWWGWGAAIIIFAVVQAWRALIRATKGTAGSNRSAGGMARLNAAAERILKERADPKSGSAAAKAKPSRVTGASKPRTSAPLPKSTTPAVVRRNTTMLGGREPVITRRR